ncbi:MAG: hypothetical protein AABZ32_08915 [Bacteroidota bacterium]
MENHTLPMVQIDFGIIDHETSERLSKLIAVAVCPICNSKTIILKEGEKTIVRPICHEKFADLIGITMNSHHIDKYAVDIRGKIINVFTLLEKFIDEIIRRKSFDSEADYDKYVNIFLRGEMTMKVKMQLFEICIAKYEKAHQVKCDGLLDSLNAIIDKRNHLVHWTVDTSKQGVEFFLNKNKIRFIFFDKKDKRHEECFDNDSAHKLEGSIKKLTFDVITIFKDMKK